MENIKEVQYLPHTISNLMVGGANLYMCLSLLRKRLLNKHYKERIDNPTMNRAELVTEWSEFWAQGPNTSIGSDQSKEIMEETTMNNGYESKPKPRSMGTNDAQVVFCSHCGGKM